MREVHPVPLTQEGLEALCVSLNRPVVDVANLPVGPARAAIALHRSDAGESCLAVALRSIDAGVVEVFRFRGEPHESVDEAMDAGLSFAEGMGFLFDDDLIAGAESADAAPDLLDEAAGSPRERGAERAHALWCELVGEELPEPSAAAEPGALLSKFRSRGAPGDARPDESPGAARAQPCDRDPNEDSQQAQLGRIPLVRRRSEESQASQDLVTRLVASF